MRELDQAVVEAILGWEEVLQAVAKITTDAPANYFAEHDAKTLENAAARIRRKLKDAKDETPEYIGPAADF